VRVSTERFRAIAAKPPLPARILGAALLAYDVVSWNSEGTPTSWLELAKHTLILMIALAMVYPEGALIVTSFLRRAVPMLDRRKRGRDAD